MRRLGCLEIVAQNESYKADPFINNEQRNNLFKVAHPQSSPEKFFKLLVEFSDDWIYWINPDSTIAFNSPSCKYVTGYDTSDEIFSDLHFLDKLIHPQYFENLKRHNRLVNTGGNVCYENFAIITKSGEVKGIHHYCQAVYDVNGVYLGRYVCNKNLSEIQKQGLLFPFDEKIMQKIYDNHFLGYYQIYFTGRLKCANQTFLEILGYNSINELLDMNIDSNCLINSDERKVFISRLLGNGFVKEFESKWIKKDWEIVYLKETASTVNGKDGDEPFYQGIVENITDKKLAEQAEKNSITDQSKSEKLKTEFLSMISHEIRTPLNVILNYIQMMKTDSGNMPENEKNELMDIMVDEGERIKRTIDLILEMSQLRSETYEYIFTEINLVEDVLNPIINAYAEKIKKKNLQIILTDRTDRSIIHADRQSVTQIFTQLLDNAVKYTQEGAIEIIVFLNFENQVCVSVADKGIGINEEYMLHLFSLFSQEDNSYSRMFEGTGLGLALVKKHCELNKAAIEVKSKKNVGSEFTVKFLDKADQNKIRDITGK